MIIWPRCFSCGAERKCLHREIELVPYYNRIETLEVSKQRMRSEMADLAKEMAVPLGIPARRETQPASRIAVTANRMLGFMSR